jgi:DNA-binding protein HU-beta
LIEQALPAAPQKARRGAPTIAAGELGDIFGIELETGQALRKTTAARGKTATPGIERKVARAQAPAKKTATKAVTAKKAPAAKATSGKAATAKAVSGTSNTAVTTAPSKTRKPPTARKG